MTSFVLAASYVAGAVSLIPGGIGAAEASVVGLLVVVGVDPATATAAALLQRIADKGFATLMGFIAYAIARRRFRLSGLTALRPGPPAQPGAGETWSRPGPERGRPDHLDRLRRAAPTCGASSNHRGRSPLWASRQTPRRSRRRRPHAAPRPLRRLRPGHGNRMARWMRSIRPVYHPDG